MLRISTLILVFSAIYLTYGYESPIEEKDFKKILKQHKNVLVLSAPNDQSAKATLQIFKQIEEEIRGRGTLVYVNCEKGKKLCKKLKHDSTNAELRHFQDGDFHKVYDRSLAAKSMINFMLDPKGDMPWNEDPLAGDVLHLHTAKDFQKTLKQPLPSLVMFYAPWCGYCKRLKPVFAEAATDLRGQYILAGMDVDKVENYPIRKQFNITGFPTTIYFEKGQQKFHYSGGHTKDDIINWLKNPQPVKEASEEKDDKQDFFPTDSENVNYIVHLNDTTFDGFITENSQSPILVMFYAPWCGHCKNIKPELIQASIDLHEQQHDAKIVAIDATKAPILSKQYKITGFPTMKFFRDGKYAFDAHERTADKIVEFLKDPKEPPPPEREWSEQESDVIHLNDENFKTILKKKKAALVFFYAPWCGHCKNAKPLFTKAAAALKDNPKVAFCAVDCTKSQAMCKEHEVQGYPTIKYFSFGKFVSSYEDARTEEAFVEFMNNPEEQSKKVKPTPAPADPAEFWKEATGYEHVHMLQSNTFDSIVGPASKALVMFYAPWCGHCKTSKPAFASVASQLASTHKDIVIGAVDATIARDLGIKYEVKGFPTFKYFENGKFVSEYNGGRGEQDFLQFLTGSTGTVQNERRIWTPSGLYHLMLTFFNFIVLFVRSLIDPTITKHGKNLEPTNYRAGGGSGGGGGGGGRYDRPPDGRPRRRMGGFGGTGGGPGCAPMAGG
ncbi:unnamed protein product [Adineta steineri]|uniref:Thioredoxin domain-containing protein n=2 Tax=Adineta steineri TaxID=433720 RepID=A0A818R6N6_9BILA|nr:unnamed protein product [Adineta steineri]